MISFRSSTKLPLKSRTCSDKLDQSISSHKNCRLLSNSKEANLYKSWRRGIRNDRLLWKSNLKKSISQFCKMISYFSNIPKIKSNLLRNFIISSMNQRRNLISNCIWEVKSTPRSTLKERGKRESEKADQQRKNGRMTQTSLNIVTATRLHMVRW